MALLGITLADLWGARLWSSVPPWVERELGRQLQAPVRLASVEGGIFRPLVLRQVQVGSRLAMNRLVTQLHWWDFLRARRAPPWQLKIINGAVAGLGLSDLNGIVTLRGRQAQMRSLRGRIGGQPMQVRGVVPLGLEDAGLDAVAVIHTRAMTVKAHLTGSWARPHVNGEARLGALVASFSGRAFLEPDRRLRFDLAIGDAQAIHGHADPARREVSGVAMVPWSREPQPFTMRWQAGGLQAEIEVTQLFLGRHHLDGHAALTVEAPAAPAVKPIGLPLVRKLHQVVLPTPRAPMAPWLVTLTLDPVRWDGLVSSPMRGRFRCAIDQWAIETFQWGSLYQVAGAIRTVTPEEIGLRLEIAGADLERGEALFFPRGHWTGLMDGWMELSGRLPLPQVRGELTLSNGQFGPISYERCLIKMRGTWPVVQVEDSQLVLADRRLKLEGQVDLRRLHYGELLRRLVAKADLDAVWEGWQVAQEAVTDEFRWQRDMGRLQVDWIRDQDTSFTYQEVPRDLELRYRVKQDEQVKMKVQGEERFLGVERKMTW